MLENSNLPVHVPGNTQTSNLAYLTHDNADEAAREIMARLGDLTGYEPLCYQVLVAVYVRPDEVTLRNGAKFIIPQKTVGEDIWQGKCGLVVKLGAGAYVPDRFREFEGLQPKVGDWVLISPTEGIKFQINEQHVRLVNDDKILMLIPAPRGVL